MTTKVKIQLLVDAVFDSLKKEILSGELVPGKILAENAQAERFGVSKGPAREALKRLVGLGFLRSLPRVGYIVTGIKISDLDEIFDVRIAIEPLAVRRAMSIMSPEDLDSLERLAAGEPAAKTAPIDDRGDALVQANRNFHVEIARMSGNSRFERIISNSVDELERVIQLLALDLEAQPDEHPGLVQAMRTGDFGAAEHNMREQLIANHDAMRQAATGAGNGRYENAIDLY